jgi:hypothetical protein
MTAAGFPHSGISGSTPTCGSPKLIAAYHALLRLSVPRHPPCALLSLDRICLAGSSKGLLKPRTPVHRTFTHALVLSSADSFARLLVHPTHYPNCQMTNPVPGVLSQTNARPVRNFPRAPHPKAEDSSTRLLQKGGDPAAGSPTATLLRLRPSHRARLRPLPPLRVGSRTSGAPDSHGVTGGVYKARERIHRGVADPRLLAIPASCSRVTDCNPNLDQVFAIRSASRPRCALSWPL